MKISSIFIFYFLLSFIFYVPFLYGDGGKYAILLYGGYEVMSKEGGSAGNPEYVEHEIANMYNTLIEEYEYPDGNIYVHVLNGDEEDTTFTKFFDQIPANYLPGTSNSLIATFQDVNYAIDTDGFTEHLVFIFISGHQRRDPDNGTNYYQFYPSYPYSDSSFACWLQDYLFDGPTDPSKYVFVTGFCSSWGFYNPEIQNECYIVSYAAADEEEGTSPVDTSPNKSFMKFYADAMHEPLNFKSAFEVAESDMKDANPTINDDPIKGTKFEGSVETEGNGWDQEWSLNGDITAPDAPENLAYDHNDESGHPVFVWDANSESDLKEYEVWRRPAYETYWEILGTTVDTCWTDTDVGTLDPAARIFYKVRAIDLWGNKSLFSNEAYVDGFIIIPKLAGNGYKKHIPSDYFLAQNYPNPFNPTSTIELALPESEFIELKIYDCTGSEVATLVATDLPAAFHTFKFDGGQLASGVYYYRVSAGGFHDVKKMILLR